MNHFPTIADAEEAGAPGCFSDEYAFHERNGTLAPGGSYFPAADSHPDPEWPEPEQEQPDPEWPEPEQEQPDPVSVATLAIKVYCPEGDDNVCPTLTCGCPPF